MASPTPREIAMEARKREFDAKRRAANRQKGANLLGMASNPGALLRGAADIPGSVYRYLRDNEPVEIGEDVSRIASDMAGDFRKDPVKFAVDMVNPVTSVQDFADIRAQARDLRAAGDLDTASMLEQVAAMSPLAVVPVVGKVLGKGAKKAAKKAASLAVKPAKAAAEKTAPLAMDETSRMARAATQGFDRDAYKGAYPYDASKGPVYGFRNGKFQAIENIGAVPPELTYFSRDKSTVVPGPYSGFFSSSPEVSNRFANAVGGGASYPVKLKLKNPLVFDASGKHAAAYQFDESAKRNGTLKELDAFRRVFSENNDYDGVILKNTLDEGTVYVPKTPSQVRSRFAAFDPDKLDSDDLGHAHGGRVSSLAVKRKGKK